MSRRLKILMTADTVGGVWQYCIDLVSALLDNGAEILLATMGPRPSAQQKRQIDELRGVELAESEYALEWTQEPWHDVDDAGEWLLKLQTGFGADIIHLNGYSHAALAWNTPVLVTAHSCVFSWWRAVHGGAPDPQWNEYKRRIAAGLEAATAIIAPTEFMAQALTDEYGIPKSSTKVIHNFSGMQRIPGSRKEAFCLAAGRLWDPAKNLRLLEQIAPELDWPIRVAGSEHRPGSGRPGAAACPDSIELLGSLDHEDFLTHLRGAGLFLHPALYEPFGLAVLEAANSHCCLILSDIPSLRELWDGAAVFVNPQDPQGWAHEVNRLCRDSASRELHATRSYSRAAVYNCERTAGEYLSTYRNLLEAKKTRGVAA